MTQHTPGPWTVVDGNKQGRMPEIRAGQVSLADIRWNGHNEKHGEANARLIAAAPAMLALIRHVATIEGNASFRQMARALLVRIEGKL